MHQALLPLTHEAKLDVVIRCLHHIPTLPHRPDNLLLMQRNIADIILYDPARFGNQPLACGLVGFHRNAADQLIQPRIGIATIVENTARADALLNQLRERLAELDQMSEAARQGLSCWAMRSAPAAMAPPPLRPSAAP